MKEAVLSLFALGWIDFFNPVSISMVMLLIPIVRRRWHVLLYVFGAYAAYAAASVAIYFGIDKYLRDFWLRLCSQYPYGVAIGKVCVAAVALLGCVGMLLFLIKAARQKRELSMSSMLRIQSVAPWFIVALSFGSTWSNMFAAFAMFAYMAVLSANGIAFSVSIVFICFFSLFSLVPTLSVYILSFAIKGERFQRVMEGIRKVMTGFCFYSIPVLLAFVAYWGFATGVPVLVG